jgi:hypothetical protein
MKDGLSEMIANEKRSTQRPKAQYRKLDLGVHHRVYDSDRSGINEGARR